MTTVGDLIAQLEQFDRKLPVYYEDTDTGEYTSPYAKETSLHRSNFLRAVGKPEYTDCVLL
jgi:hypothetical protein